MKREALGLKEEEAQGACGCFGREGEWLYAVIGSLLGHGLIGSRGWEWCRWLVRRLMVAGEEGRELVLRFGGVNPISFTDWWEEGCSPKLVFRGCPSFSFLLFEEPVRTTAICKM